MLESEVFWLVYFDNKSKNVLTFGFYFIKTLLHLFEMRNRSQKHGFFTLAGQHNLVKKIDIKNIEI